MEEPPVVRYVSKKEKLLLAGRDNATTESVSIRLPASRTTSAPVAPPDDRPPRDVQWAVRSSTARSPVPEATQALRPWQEPRIPEARTIAMSIREKLSAGKRPSHILSQLGHPNGGLSAHDDACLERSPDEARECVGAVHEDYVYERDGAHAGPGSHPPSKRPRKLDTVASLNRGDGLGGPQRGVAGDGLCTSPGEGGSLRMLLNPDREYARSSRDDDLGHRNGSRGRWSDDTGDRHGHRRGAGRDAGQGRDPAILRRLPPPTILCRRAGSGLTAEEVRRAEAEQMSKMQGRQYKALAQKQATLRSAAEANKAVNRVTIQPGFFQ